MMTSKSFVQHSLLIGAYTYSTPRKQKKMKISFGQYESKFVLFSVVTLSLSLSLCVCVCVCVCVCFREYMEGGDADGGQFWFRFSIVLKNSGGIFLGKALVTDSLAG